MDQLQPSTNSDKLSDQLASIIASATLYPFSLAHGSPRRAERSRGYLDGCQDRSTHRAGRRPEKWLRGGHAVRTREEKVVYRCEACPLSRVVEPSQLMVPQREVPVTPFRVRAGALEHISQLGRLCLQLTLLSEAQVI